MLSLVKFWGLPKALQGLVGQGQNWRQGRMGSNDSAAGSLMGIIIKRNVPLHGTAMYMRWQLEQGHVGISGHRGSNQLIPFYFLLGFILSFLKI